MSLDWRAGRPANNKMRDQTLIASSLQRSDKRFALSASLGYWGLSLLSSLLSHLSGGNWVSLLGIGQVEPGDDKLSDIITLISVSAAAASSQRWKFIDIQR